MNQIKVWLEHEEVQKVVMVIQGADSKEVLERWSFDIQLDKNNTTENASKPRLEKDINAEIATIIRQITASVSFLPIIEERATFNVLVYADKEADVPQEWMDTDPKLIKNPEQVKLRSFTTGFHTVETQVCYNVRIIFDL